MVREVKTRVREIRVDQLAALRAATPPPIVIDVREDHEWIKSGIPGAIHVGRGVLEIKIESRIPQKGDPSIVYCQGGVRSAVAPDVLGKMGYTNVLSLAGGRAAYQAAGLLLNESPPSSSGRCESVRTWGLGRLGRGATPLDISMHPAEGVRD
jgi:rhodanese-related sulfurtransferase